MNEKDLDIIQRYNYCKSDFEEVFHHDELTRGDIYRLILIISWVLEIYEYLYPKRNISKQEEDIVGYIKAIRSLVVAHPIKTDRHKKYGFDGTVICVDVIPKEELDFTTFLFTSKTMQKQAKHLRFNEVKEYNENEKYDFALVTYNSCDNYKYKYYYLINLNDFKKCLMYFEEKIENLIKGDTNED